MDNEVTDIILYMKKLPRITKLTKKPSKNGLRNQLTFQGNTIFLQQIVLQSIASYTAKLGMKDKLIV